MNVPSWPDFSSSPSPPLPSNLTANTASTSQHPCRGSSQYQRRSILPLTFPNSLLDQIQPNCCLRWNVPGPASLGAKTVTATRNKSNTQSQTTPNPVQSYQTLNQPQRLPTLTVSAQPLPPMLSATRTWSPCHWTTTSSTC